MPLRNFLGRARPRTLPFKYLDDEKAAVRASQGSSVFGVIHTSLTYSSSSSLWSKRAIFMHLCVEKQWQALLPPTC